MEPFQIIEPKGKRVPILISVPHCGTEFPKELEKHYNPKLIKILDDTDWYVDRLYDFASEMGITMITARYHRWVIDLNRDPESKPLYDDGRIITGLCSTTDFFGNKIYANPSYEPDEKEISRRLEKYYWPYYRKIESILSDLKKEFGKVLFYDAHSIRKHVPTIRKDPFPDLILGTNDEQSADKIYIQIALEELKKAGVELTHNFPFKGGHLTRYFGKPSENQHALQLERSKLLYMNDKEDMYDEHRAKALKTYLRRMVERLTQEISK